MPSNLASVRTLLSCLALLITAVTCLHAQTATNECFEYFSFSLPLDENEIRTGEADVFVQPMNRLNYRSEDSNTFWYRMVTTEDVEVRFSLFSLNYVDIYEPLLFVVDGEDICTRIVTSKAEPKSLQSEAAYNYGDSISQQIVKEFTFNALAGTSYFLGVVEIDGEGCGHKLFVNAEEKSSVFKSVKEACHLKESLALLRQLSAKKERVEDHHIGLQNVESSMISTFMTNVAEYQAFMKAQESEIALQNPTNKIAVNEQSTPALESPSETQNRVDESVVIEPPLPLIEEATSVLESNDPVLPIEESSMQFRDWETGQVIPAEHIELGQEIVLNNIYFYNNTYAFKHTAFEELNRLVAFLNTHPDIEMEVKGHTAGNTRRIVPDPRYKNRGKGWDFKGNSEQLSEYRALAVKDFLVEKGIHAGRITTTGLGDSQRLIASPTDFEEAMLNMRVEIVFTDR